MTKISVDSIVLEQIINEYNKNNKDTIKLTSPLDNPDAIIASVDKIEEMKDLKNYTRVIYYSSDIEDSIFSLENGAFYFILSPFNKKEVLKLIEIIRDTSFEIKQKNKIITHINTKDITYVNIECRSLCFHLMNGTNIYSQCLRQPFHIALKSLISNSEFILAGTGILINLKNIKSIGPDSITFKNNDTAFFPKTNHHKIYRMWK